MRRERRRHVPQARQILRKLLEGKLTFRACAEAAPPRYEFTGTGVLDGLLSGTAIALSVASPTGSVTSWTIDFRRRFRAA
jgi:hypothetical protein